MSCSASRLIRRLTPLLILTVATVWLTCAVGSAAARTTASPRIINGTEIAPADIASQGRWDALVALISSDTPAGDEYNGQFCGGTLIAPEWVVTAAHCVVDDRNPANTDVLVDWLDLAAPGGQRVKLTGVYVHPGYDATSMRNDVALLRLAAPVPDAVAHPMGLITGINAWMPGDSLWAAGWGSVTSYDAGDDVQPGFPTIAREVELPRVSDAKCGGPEPGLGSDFLSPFMLCAGLPGQPHGNDDGRDTCQGDSGGPLVTDEAVPRLVGIVSFGYGCGSSTYGAYARVAALSDWITDTQANPPTSIACSLLASDDPDRQPTNVRITRSTFSTVTVTWGDPVCVGSAGFDVWQRSRGDLHKLAALPTSTHTYTVRGLLPGKPVSLNVDVRAGSPNHGNYYSDGVDIGGRTLVDRINPTRPARVFNRGAGRASVVVGWTGARDNDRIRGYRTYYRVAGGSWRAGPLLGASARRGTIAGLQRGTTYIVAVRAVDYAGRLSAFSPTVSIRSR